MQPHLLPRLLLHLPLLACLSSLVARGSQPHGRVLQEEPAPPQWPRIYVYDMPPLFKNATRFGDISDSFYGLDQLFPELLNASPYITNNSSEADFFYVSWCCVCGVGGG